MKLHRQLKGSRMVVIVKKPETIGRGAIDLHINVTGQVNITADEARRKVSGYVLSYISERMHGGEPSLVVGECLTWRVPVILSWPPHGDRGQAGEIDVDVETGQLLITDSIIDEIQTRAHHLVTRSPQNTAAG
jgi:hypothetical protein